MSLIGQHVTVLGAGIAGLAVARALALRGAAVTVLEQADAIREVGAGLQISPERRRRPAGAWPGRRAGRGRHAGRGGGTDRWPARATRCCGLTCSRSWAIASSTAPT